MQAEHAAALVQAGVLSFASIFTTALFVLLARRAASGRLARNQWIGIRTPSTLRSDSGWVTGHRAALRLTPLFLLSSVATFIALFAVALYTSTPAVVTIVGLGMLAGSIALILYSAYVASNAAKSAEGISDDREKQ